MTNWFKFKVKIKVKSILEKCHAEIVSASFQHNTLDRSRNEFGMKIIIISIFITLISSGYVRPDVYKIDAEKNAVLHNNLGLNAVSDNNYYQAIQEFCIAIALNPNTQATSVYYNNLGETYMKLGYYNKAQGCFEKSIAQYKLNLLYYQNFVASLKAQNLVKSKIPAYERDNKNSLNMVTLGLLYVANGDLRRGIIKLDEFCMSEPDLLITPAVRDYIKAIVPKD